MKTKLLALGNVLMEDDGIAVFLAAVLEERLREIDIEVIYGETDLSFCISQIEEGDQIIVLDAARQGKEAGEVSLFRVVEGDFKRQGMDWHDTSFLNLVKLYFPNNCCYLITIEVAEVKLQYGVSPFLSDRIMETAQEVLSKVKIAFNNI